MALLFALSGGAIAATGGFSSGGKLQACVNEEGGLKLLKPGKHCRRGLKSVAWNLAGRTGAKVATGAAGAPGAKGLQGLQGSAGAKGDPGANGTARAFGVIASTGAVVPANTTGLTSSKVGEGVYCVRPTAASGIDFSTVEPVVVADFNDGSGTDHLAQTVAAGTTDAGECLGGWVFVTDNYEGTSWKRGNIAFTIVVP